MRGASYTPRTMDDTEARFIDCRGVTRVYGSGAGRTVALDGVDLAIPAGASVALVGPSGSGKSTLLHLIGGLDRADAGSVRVAGTDVGALGDRDASRYRLRDVGFVFQFFNLVPTLDAVDNVALPARLAGRPAREARERARKLLDAVGLAREAGRLPEEISGGQQQRVAVARALVNEPRLVLADEPTGALDRAAAADVLDLLETLVRDRGATFVLATHSAAAAARAERIVRIEDGAIVESDAALDRAALDEFEAADRDGAGR